MDQYLRSTGNHHQGAICGLHSIYIEPSNSPSAAVVLVLVLVARCRVA